MHGGNVDGGPRHDIAYACEPGQGMAMFTAYLNAAMRKAHDEILPAGEGYFGTIEGLQGIWANAGSLEACREELQEALEEWIVLGLRWDISSQMRY